MNRDPDPGTRATELPPRSRGQVLRSNAPSLAVLLLSVGASIFVARHFGAVAQERARNAFDDMAYETAHVLENRIDTYVDVLIGTAGLFEASEHVSGDEFARYVAALGLEERYGGIQGVGFSVHLPAASLDSLVAARRAVGSRGFRVWPAPAGDALHAIVYLVPPDVRNREAIGYDMSSEPVRREAMARARDSGAAAVSRRVTLVQEIDEDVQPGFLIYVPVYEDAEIPGSVAERRARLHGFVYSPFRARDLMLSTLRPNPEIEVQVFDGTAAEDASLLYDSRAEGGAGTHEPRFRRVMPVDVQGRPWTVVVGSAPGFAGGAGDALATYALAGGLALSLILFLLTRFGTTARERAQEAAAALRASETQYRMLFESNPHPMWVYDRATLGFLAVNRAAVRQYGYSADEFLGLTLRDIRPAEELPLLEANLADTRREPRVWKHLRKDGSTVLVEISSDVVTFAGREARLVLAHDVTERMRSRSELERAQQRLARILTLSNAVIYTMDVRGTDFTTTWVSDNLVRVTGYTVRQGLQRNWWFERVHPEDREAVTSTDAEFLERGRRTLEYRFRHADGHWMWIRDDAVVRRDDGGDAVEVIGAWVEVTERRRLEEQFQQAQKMEAVGRLAGGIAHDFNNILTVIRSQTDLLLMDTEGEIAAEIGLIQSTADRAARLTSQLLAFSREQMLRPTVVDAAEVVRGMVRLLERIVGERMVIVQRLPENLPAIEVDPGQLEQALMNLVVNARDAMPDGGTLTLSARSERLDERTAELTGGIEAGSYTVLDVADTGVGMDAETQARIFDPFFTTKPKGKGTGLGLPMVYGFVRQSGGGISVRSEPGRGTTFSLYFPATEKRPEQTPAEPVGAATARETSGRVLLVEDEPSVAKVAQRILERGGMSVQMAADAEAALLALEANGTFDLVLTDLGLPGMSGHELVERVRARTPELPLIVMSGYAEGSLEQQVQIPRNIDFLQKPFTADALMEAVRRALRSRA